MSASIPHMLAFFKRFGVGLAGGIFLGSFLVQYGLPTSPVPTMHTAVPELKRGGYIVGNSSAKKYHFPWCEGVEKISEGNKVWFENSEQARAAGFVPAKGCKGLE
jgi:hypothetical protein